MAIAETGWMLTALLYSGLNPEIRLRLGVVLCPAGKTVTLPGGAPLLQGAWRLPAGRSLDARDLRGSRNRRHGPAARDDLVVGELHF